MTLSSQVTWSWDSAKDWAESYPSSNLFYHPFLFIFHDHKYNRVTKVAAAKIHLNIFNLGRGFWNTAPEKDFLYIWVLELGNNLVLLKKFESTRYKDAELHRSEDRAGGKEDLRPNMRLTCCFGFSKDEGSRREQRNSQRGQFPMQRWWAPEEPDEDVDALQLVWSQ